MSIPSRRQIARRYLPDRHLYWYSLCKLAMDPLYAVVREALEDNRAPLLDVGCGIGILLHCLRAGGHDAPYVGVDSDAAKLDAARKAATQAALDRAHFRCCDLGAEFPEHRGSIALLDVLQYLEPDAQHRLVANAARCLTDDAVLVMRGGLDDGSWRAALTRAVDRFGCAVRWIGSSFKVQPKPQELAALLRTHGLQAQFRPAWGRTPFNNWLIVAKRLS